MDIWLDRLDDYSMWSHVKSY